MKQIQIAIDGPAAAGKSTIAKQTAELLGYTYVDTGAMYRAITYKALGLNIDLQDGTKLTELLKETSIELKPSPKGQLVFLDQVEVTEEIRSKEVTANVSVVAAHANLREEMVKRQIEMGKHGGVVMDGRDIGTHVLTNAELKIFMSASVEERANRRFLENQKRGIHTNLEELMHDIALRDKLDSEREASPLVKAKDAIFIDTTSLTIKEVSNKIMQLAQERMV
ncbi:MULTISPECIES: (d)CMP kinase [Psychrobacillus]|uniref:Cytidylate kinase n=1 Tax=Psychrobacillus faecigallinarum TaxID=2762235 RepID=A0ABR8RBP2_9BACI|nr:MULTISPECIES: (d)CMP kinase [Psychrobacillus]MBD7945175.1 (d)CMP kinase [Psychrobacillus faecigallinarum]QEY19873.1 (d)CMP kinase [Psychrobacillus sp. AK 1817]QGM30413.1 (d)CMP kinase [Bacillus sp. N3536]